MSQQKTIFEMFFHTNPLGYPVLKTLISKMEFEIFSSGYTPISCPNDLQFWKFKNITVPSVNRLSVSIIKRKADDSFNFWRICNKQKTIRGYYFLGFEAT